MTLALWAVGLGAIAWLSLRRPAEKGAEPRKRALRPWQYWTLVVILAFAAAALLRFGFQWLVVAGGLIAATARRALPLLRWAPWVSRVVSGAGKPNGWTASQTPGEGYSRGFHSHQQPPQARGAGRMSQDEALAVLGLRRGASREEIEREYRRLMGKVHPDRGGSNYLASKLNEARETLL